MLIERESPYGWNLYLDEASDNAGGTAEGQGSEPNTDPLPEGEPVVPESFYTYTEDDGSETAYTDASKLSERIKSGTLRHDDYTRKNQAREAKYKEFETTKATHDADYVNFTQLKTDLDGRQAEIDKIEKELKSWPKDLYAKVKQGLRNQPRNQERDPELQKIIDERKTEKEERTEQKRISDENTMRDQAFEALSKTYKDFDKAAIESAVKELEETAPGDSMRKFMELMYYAGKGRTTPAELERKLAQDLEKKGTLNTPMSNSKHTPDTGIKTYSSSKEARKAAMEDNGLL